MSKLFISSLRNAHMRFHGNFAYNITCRQKKSNANLKEKKEPCLGEKKTSS